jgi:putative transposase
VFFGDSDRQAYLDDLGYYSGHHSLEILAYCLMDNHVHLLHAQRINMDKDWCGHLWQDRYYSSALDERHLWTAIRYVELNPVRAGMIARAERYQWSSAAAHCGLRSDRILSKNPDWCRRLAGIANWTDWLAQAVDSTSQAMLRENTRKGLPTGCKEFVRNIERATGRNLARRPRGRPARSVAHLQGTDA